jgi:HSP20 family protein
MVKVPFSMNPAFSLDNLQSEFGRFLERMWHGGLQTGPLDGQDWAPTIELREDATSYRVLIEAPGVEQPSVDVTIDGSSLIVSGEKLSGASVGGEPGPFPRIVHSERRYGSFKRAIPLPGPVQADGTSATLRHGVLEITLLKAPGSQTVSVQVKVGPSPGA